MSSLKRIILIFISSLVISVEFIKISSATPSISSNSKRLGKYYSRKFLDYWNFLDFFGFQEVKKLSWNFLNLM